MSDEKTYDQTDPLIGRLIDQRYRVTRRLARGGMATVYVAQDERLERPVALKVMHPHLAESDAFVERFHREARAAARIVHPGVVSVFDQGVVSGQGFLVMELIDGTNLRALLNAQGAFTIPQALRYTTDILEALRAAHRMGVIHRDIKPENILVPTDGPAKVADFGLARAVSEGSTSATGNMLGTVAYIAPEIALTTEANARSDLYSVGIMLYEMLTGAVPWADESPLQIASHHVSEDVPSPSATLPWIPREIDDLVAALTARNPANRCADASDALDLVARAAASIPSDIANRRAEVAHEDSRSGSETTALNTEVMPTQLTQAMPAPHRDRRHHRARLHPDRDPFRGRTSCEDVHASDTPGCHRLSAHRRRQLRRELVVDRVWSRFLPGDAHHNGTGPGRRAGRPGCHRTGFFR